MSSERQDVQPSLPQEAPQEPFLNHEPEKVWNNYYQEFLNFPYSESKLFGHGMLTGNPHSRVRAVNEAIHAITPLAENEIQNDNLAENLTKLHNFFNRVIKGAPPRSSYFSAQTVSADIWIEKLLPENHPIIQAWGAVYALNQARITENQGKAITLQKKALTTAELSELSADLVLSYFPETVKDRYNEYADARQRGDAELKNRPKVTLSNLAAIIVRNSVHASSVASEPSHIDLTETA